MLAVLLLSLALVLFFVVRRLVKPVRNKGIYAVLGSGGHTNELMRMIGGLPEDLQPTHYIVGEDDSLSVEKLAHANGHGGKYRLVRLPRPRAVGQSYLSSIATSVRTLYECVQVFRVSLPHMVPPPMQYGAL